jgi:hypothetical protein
MVDTAEHLIMLGCLLLFVILLFLALRTAVESRKSTLFFAGIALLWVFIIPLYHGIAARSNDDIAICKKFYIEALNRMADMNGDTFQPSDLTFEQMHNLTPTDPDWRGAEFLVLNEKWKSQKDGKKIVIVCSQSRIKDKQRMYCIGYDNGEVAYVGEDVISQLQLRDYLVLPKVR